MKTLNQTKQPASDIQHRTPNGGINTVLPFRCWAFCSVGLVVLLFLCFCRPAVAEDAPPVSPAAISAARLQRLDEMKAKGPNASLTILPAMLAGRPFDRVSAVIGVSLEQKGLQKITLGKTPFTAGVKADFRVLSAALGAFLRTNSIATDYALYTEFNGPTLDEIRALVVDKTGEIVWVDHQTTQDKDFQALGTPRDPMILIGFLVDRLSPQFRLNDDTAKNRRWEQENAFQSNSGYAPARERDALMPARLKVMRESRPHSTLMVLGVRMDRTGSVTNANDLAKRISEAKIFQKIVPAKQPVLIEAKLTGDQMKYLWDIAREFQAYVKKNPPDADYVLYADYIFDRQHWQQGGVQFVVCDRQGEWVLAELTNSDQEDYQRVKPISPDGCDKLLVERLADRLGLSKSNTLHRELTVATEVIDEKYNYDGGYFGRIANNSHAQWKEGKNDLSEKHYFEELKRDSDIILLNDASRHISVQIPIKGGVSKISVNGEAWGDLYEVRKE